MPKAKLTPTQQQFLDDYKVTHSVLKYGVKLVESERFLQRKGEVLDALDAVPTFAAQNLRQAVAAADLRADIGDFGEAHDALKQAEGDARQLKKSYDPTNDLQTIDQDLQSHLKRAKPAADEAAKARLTHRDAAASTADEQAAIDNLLKKTIVFLTSADQELKDITFRLGEVTRCCKLPAHQQKATALATTLQTGTTAASVIMKSAQTYQSPDEARKLLAAKRDQQLKDLNSYNQCWDQVQAVRQKFPHWRLTTPIQQSLTDADKAFKKRDYGAAFNSLQAALTGATALANSYQPAADLQRLDAELTTFLGKAKPAATEVAKVRNEHTPGGDAAELAVIDPKIPLATAFLPNAGSDYKRLSEQLNELLNRFCKLDLERTYAKNLILKLRNGMEEIGSLLKPSGEFYTLPELRMSLVAMKPAPEVAAKFAAEATADTKALASAARIHQAADQGAAVPQLQIVPRANIADKLSAGLATVATANIPRDQMLKAAATAASRVLDQMLQGIKDQAERIDLMLVIATDDLDGLLKSSMPGVNWGADPKLLGELADATRKDLANVITNRVVVHGNQETAQIGGESYDFKQELGRGGLGIAKLFESKDGKKKLVLKEPQMRASNNIPADIQYQMVMASNREMANELRAHFQASQSNHPNVLKLVDLCIGPDGRVRAVMEVAAGGDVKMLHRILEALSDLGVLPQAARAAVERDMAAQMLLGIAAMHGTGVVHHDLKGENVFLKADGTVQVADFGSGIAMTAQGKTPQVAREIGTTEPYAPPKGSPKVEHDEAFDIFTVGKILERDLGTPGEAGGTASSADRLRQALTRSDADKRSDLEAAAKTAYIAEVNDFRNTPEYKDLLKEVMAAQSTALGKFIKARFRLVHCLDICRCDKIRTAMEPIDLLAGANPGAKYDELHDIFKKIRETTDDYYKAVITKINPLSAKDFSGTVAKADEKAKSWIEMLQEYATKDPARSGRITLFAMEHVKHKNLVQKFVSKYEEVLGSVDWNALRAPTGGSKISDEQKQIAIDELAKAEMRLSGILEAFDEVAPRIAELVRAIGELVRAINTLVQAKMEAPGAKPGELETIRKAGWKFVAAIG
jgi:serine/threonine protein kinase